MFGPFKVGDVKAVNFDAIDPGAFVLVGDQLAMKVKISRGPNNPTWAAGVLRFGPDDLSIDMVAPGSCLAVEVTGQLQVAYGGIGGAVASGHLGVTRSGGIWLAATYDSPIGPELVYVDDLTTGSLSRAVEHGVTWCSTWQLDLVLDDRRRIALASRRAG